MRRMGSAADWWTSMVNMLCVGLLVLALIGVMAYVIITDEERLK